jgi:hypothetical protein
MTIIKIKLFALAKEIVGGKAEITLEFTEGMTITVPDLKKMVLQSYPGLGSICLCHCDNSV